jgi:hypothetical protein
VAWGVLVFFPVQWLWIMIFSHNMWPTVSYVTFWGLGCFASYLYFGRTKRCYGIVESRPLFHNSQAKSIALWLIFEIVFLVFFLFGHIVSLHLFDHMIENESLEEIINQFNS